MNIIVTTFGWFFPTYRLNSDIKFMHSFLTWNHGENFQRNQNKDNEDCHELLDIYNSLKIPKTLA